MSDPKLIKEGMEYDDFRRGLFCYYSQERTFKKLLWMYTFITLITSVVVGLHNLLNPDFPAYFTSLFDQKKPELNVILLNYVSAAIEFYMVGLCIIHVGEYD